MNEPITPNSACAAGPAEPLAAPLAAVPDNDSSSQSTLSTAEADSPPQPETPYSPVAALQQLPGEPARAFSIFIRYASMIPHPPLADFAKLTGLHRSSLFRWRATYRWDERLTNYHRQCTQRLAADPGPTPPPQPDPETRAIQLDLRANAMRLARLALESWEPDAHPTSLQGVVRALELAVKLNPPAVDSDTRNAAADRRYAEFLARIERIYGPEPKPQPAETSTSTPANV